MGLSRNKVAVPEGAAGSPPFYGEYGRMFVRRCEPRRRGSRGGLGLLVWKRSWAFGSSVVGCSAGVVRMRFWAPGSPPQALAWRDSMPIVPDGGLAPSGRRGGAWWLENWIVDASKTGFPFDLERGQVRRIHHLERHQRRGVHIHPECAQHHLDRPSILFPDCTYIFCFRISL